VKKKVEIETQVAIITKVSRETKDTVTLKLQLPNPFYWEPGQFIMVSADIDNKVVKRAYSIASSPTRSEYLEITIRQTDTPTMSKFLNERSEGDQLEVRGPYGKFIWNENTSDKVVMLGAGSGITPFKAMLEYIKDKNLDSKSKLLYSCAFGDNVIFDDLLNELTKQVSCYYELSLTREQSNDFNSRKGRIDKEYLQNQIKGYEDANFYLCGTPTFVKAMRDILIEIGIEKTKVKREQWG